MKQPTLTVGVAHGNRRSSSGRIRLHPTAIRDHRGRFPDKPGRDTVNAGQDPLGTCPCRLGNVLRITTCLRGREIEIGHARYATSCLGGPRLAASLARLGFGAPATPAVPSRCLCRTGSQGRRLLPIDLACSFEANEEGPARSLEGQEGRDGHQQDADCGKSPHTSNIPPRPPLGWGKYSRAQQNSYACLGSNPRTDRFSGGSRRHWSTSVHTSPRQSTQSSPLPLSRTSPGRIIHRVRARRGVSGALYPEPAIPGLKTARGPSGRWTTGRIS